MKKLLTFSLALMLALSTMLTACSNNNANTTPAPDAPDVTAPASDVAMQYITAEDAVKLLNTDGYTFFDVRKADDYANAHIPGAVSVDMDAAKNGDFTAGVNAMSAATKDMDDELILVCYSGKTYAQATTNVLSALGYDMSKVYTLEGGFTEWGTACPDEVVTVSAPSSDVEMQYITAEEASKLLNTDGYTFFDVRKAADYATSHIPGAVSVDMDAAKEGDFSAGVIAMTTATRNLDDELIVICYSGKSYAQATTNVLSAIGYDMSKVYTLEGGFNNWQEVYPDSVES